MTIARRLCYLIFCALVLFKILLAYSENPFSFDLMSSFAGLQYGALFGSPQLFWLYKVRSLEKPSQLVVVLAAALSFCGAYAYFGFFPGQTSVNWGAPAHFEVPVALLAEWLIASLFADAFNYLAKKGSQQ